MSDKYTDLDTKLEIVQREYPELHVLIGQTRTAITKLEAVLDRLGDEDMFAIGCPCETELLVRIEYARNRGDKG